MCQNEDHTSTLDGGHRAGGPDHHEGGFTRRTALGAAGAGGVALLFAGIAARPGGGSVLEALGPDVAEAAAATCVMTPAKTVGPYFVEERLNRSDVRSDTHTGAVQPGAPLVLKLQIFDADNGCAPVKGATVDIWHANASGLYSDESANGTAGQNWLRGFQTTDADGLVTFTTVYPGWYTGRAVHIHFKVRVYDGGTETLEFTSQMFFTDAMNASVFTTYSPYKDRAKQTPDTTDGTDGILGSDAATLTLAPVADGSGGFTADFSAGISKTTSQLGNTSVGGGAPSGMTPPSAGTITTTTTAADKAVAAALKATTMIRTALGTRQVRLKLKAAETVTVTARLTRGTKTIATRKVKLTAGTRIVKVTVPSSAPAGAAKLRLTIKDAAGNSRSYTRTVHVTSLRR